ncbi:MAG: RnfH family protein [gamma proteobacterium symbiont of Ctena orbiculata]|nr:RnfH family protein [Candidatus Thiodiazotropha taylori]MBT3058533.1 RnfH family protein [Candidatus Thiodiazotropha sp. (ex Lucina pensylvanica)]MBV2096702.1 RnfH family protein [Candidatus Thiodiazotropha sp. (ex Codakia orbicularis)]PUB75556.1 MAG: RnfH family protein [gamma proteobacterium symbiont of Ctena orbiculata]MBT3063449.1 RnfH family protein [Candidatus Thiodiazotropha sp. (ex Lucina pensylvanica)]
MKFEVAFGTLDEQALLTVESAEPLTAKQAIEASGILERFPEIDLKTNKIGIFGKATKLDALLSEGDRVEIYRPLIADPKEARKKRAAEGKSMRKGGGGKN